jgi:predicted RNase H-like HicB family nuclease
MLEYHAAYYPIEDGWYLAKLLDFPGVISQGKTLQSARRMLRSALREMAMWSMEDGESLPKPNPKVKDRKAVFQETICLVLQIRRGVPA